MAVHTRYLSWGTAFLDFDHDGWKDIFIANGHIYPSVDKIPVGQRFRQERLLYWNLRDGQFHGVLREAEPDINARHGSRGIAVGDLDNDGGDRRREPVRDAVAAQEPRAKGQFHSRSGAAGIRRRCDLRAGNIGRCLAAPAARRRAQRRLLHVAGRLPGTLWARRSREGRREHPPAGKVETFTGLAANQLVVIQEGKGVLKQAPFATASPAGLRPVQVPVDEPKGPLAVDEVPAVKKLDFRPLGKSQ